MAETWLINGNSKIRRADGVGKSHGGSMARRRRSRKHRNAPRRHRRSSRRSHRRSSRASFRNPGPSKELIFAIAAGAAAYLAAEAVTRQVSKRLPAMIPKPELVGAAISSVLVGFAAKYLPANSSIKEAAQVGAGIPTVKALANAVGLGNILGTVPVIMIAAPAPGGALPAPLSAALNAQLEAALESRMNMEDSYQNEY